MPSSFTADVISILKQNGCFLVRHSKHDIWYSPASERNFSVPHNIKSRHTANEILKQAGLNKAFKDFFFDLKITRYGQPRFNIFFGPQTLFDGNGIPETLIETGMEVSWVVAIFEKARLGGT